MMTKSRKNLRRRKGVKINANSATHPTRSTAQSDLAFSTPLFPARFRKVLRYCDVGYTFASGAAGIGGNYFFSANGLFDPDITGAGHQPMGWDQMMLMYEQATCVSSKITVNAINGSAAGVYGGFGLYLSPDAVSITSVARLMENGYLKYRTMTPINTQGSRQVLSLDCDVSAYFGLNKNKRSLVGDVELYSTSAANPIEQVYFVVLAFDPTAANVVTLYFDVNIEYEVIFWEPRKLTQS